jgi:hypothetical protein
MASTFSPTLRIELIGDGDQSGIWGQTTNTNLGTLLEQAITGVVSITMTDANYTLTNFNGVSDESRNAVLVVGGTNAAVRDIITPLVEKLYVVKNSTSGGFAINVRAASGSSVSVPSGATVWVYCDGTNFNAINTESVGNFEVNGNLTVTGNTNAVAATYTGNVSALNISTANVTATGAGAFTGNVSAANFTGAGLTITSINASNISSGTIANARTTANSANGASTIVARDSSGNFTANAITANLTGTATNASNATTVTGATQNSITSIPNLTTVGTITSGTWNANAVGAAYGGTGLTTLTANNVILGNGTSAVNFVSPGSSGNVLTSNGTTWTSAIPAVEFASGTRLTFNQTAAPTGWTKDTSTNNAGFRLVSGSVSSGGSLDFTTAFSSSTAVTVSSVSGSAGATTLSTPQIPSHTHTVTGPTTTDADSYATQSFFVGQPAGRPNTTFTSAATGGGGSHTHPFSFSSGAGTVDLSVKYVDLIIAQKN